jgi:hypothetical protein
VALIVQGGLAPTVSGKVGNSVFARNRGGAYIRNFVKPINPQTVLQNAVRGAFAGLSAQWASLNAAGQLGFSNLAAATPFPNRVGLTNILPPLSMFQKMNMPRVLAGLDVVTTAPTAPFTLDWNPSAFFVEPGSTTEIAVNYDDAPTNIWQADAGSALLVYLSPPLSPGINFYKGKYNFAGMVRGSGSVNPPSPQTLTLTASLIPAAKYFYRGFVTYSNGAQGAEQIGTFNGI